MNRTVIIKTDQTKQYTSELVNLVPLDPLHCVKIYEYKEVRSIQQHRLLWLWNTEISNETGETKEEVHLRNKRDFLIRTYERDDTPSGYAKMIDDIRIVAKRSKSRAADMMSLVAELTSTTTATVNQFTEMLNDIEKFHVQQGIYLSHPEDLYYSSLGIKQ